MPFDAREATAAAEAAYPPFHFIGLDGADYYLPHPMLVPIELSQRAQSGQITGDQLLVELAPEAATAIFKLGPDVHVQLLKAWQSEINPQLEELGKELGLPSPTPTSGPPSNRSSLRAARTSGHSPSGE